ncbi:hypothetical protein Rsub_12424 [Raphidocelis subcapitata]|uniref:Uncharacterized protein n=1 Tax=Raphidocelis subcapitata TaxID=307507 RepID=A0A2V0PKZ5_9CHLO|nr:hypothetical protein Rsub_12424 [Raphidocelis subcapitata]|eukprot:GBF99712.1 hypothetical protein Rsub_12424 [Raphidocelis subcapitata]
MATVDTHAAAEAAGGADELAAPTGSGLLGSLLSPLASVVEAATDAVGAVTGTVAAAVSAGSEVLAAPPPYTEDALRLIVYQLFHGDARQQRAVLAEHYSPDALFTAGVTGMALPTPATSAPPSRPASRGGGAAAAAAPAPGGALAEAPALVELRGCEAAALALRGAQLFARITPEIHSVVVQRDRAAVLTTLHVAWLLLPLTWWRPVRADAVFLLRWGRDGRINHLGVAGSWASLLWAPLWQNVLVDWVVAKLWAPFSGVALLALVAWFRRLLQSVRAAARDRRGAAAAAAAAIPAAAASGLADRAAHGPAATPATTAAAAAAGAAAAAATALAAAATPPPAPVPAAERGAAPAPQGEALVGEGAAGAGAEPANAGGGEGEDEGEESPSPPVKTPTLPTSTMRRRTGSASPAANGAAGGAY